MGRMLSVVSRLSTAWGRNLRSRLFLVGILALMVAGTAASIGHSAGRDGKDPGEASTTSRHRAVPPAKPSEPAAASNGDSPPRHHQPALTPSAVHFDNRTYTLFRQPVDLRQYKRRFGSRTFELAAAFKADASAIPTANAPCRAALDEYRQRAPEMAAGATNFCWPKKQLGRAWRPQGIDVSAHTVGYDFHGVPASRLDLTVISSYSHHKERDQKAYRIGRTIGRLTFVQDDKRFVNVELVKPCGHTICNDNEHLGGVVWLGDKLVTPAGKGFNVFSLANLRRDGDTLILPVSERWVSPRAEAEDRKITSTDYVDRTQTPNQILAEPYHRRGPSAFYRFPLNAAGTDFAPVRIDPRSGKAVLPDVSVDPIDKRRIQGGGAYYGLKLAVSHQRYEGQPGLSSVLHVWKNRREVRTELLPDGTAESMTLNLVTRRFLTLTERDAGGSSYRGSRRSVEVISIPLSNFMPPTSRR
jgi:hypothetical protein